MISGLCVWGHKATAGFWPSRYTLSGAPDPRARSLHLGVSGHGCGARQKEAGQSSGAPGQVHFDTEAEPLIGVHHLSRWQGRPDMQQQGGRSGRLGAPIQACQVKTSVPCVQGHWVPAVGWCTPVCGAHLCGSLPLPTASSQG